VITFASADRIRGHGKEFALVVTHEDFSEVMGLEAEIVVELVSGFQVLELGAHCGVTAENEAHDVAQAVGSITRNSKFRNPSQTISNPSFF
jgi:hypothetical protein